MTIHYRVCLASALVLGLGGCASAQPTAELKDARHAYGSVQSSEANVYAPARVLSARQALERAEKAHDDDAGSSREKNLAYIAKRQAEIAAAHADIIKAEREQESAQAWYVEKQQALRERAEARLDAAENDLQDSQRMVATQARRLEREREARMQAEQRANQAIASLKEVARVKEEARGTTITLDGAVLFASGQSDLLPIAKHKLDRVADALKEVPKEKSIVVEGHTDSRGGDSTNMQLSLARAESVRSHLVSRGIDAKQVRAVGRGEEAPLATNDTAEGRANNRRVEIVIERASAPSGSSSTTSSASPPSSGAPNPSP